MSRLAKSDSVDLRRTPRGPSSERRPAAGAAGLAPAGMMPAGSCLTIPRLDGIPVEQQRWRGEQSAARLSRRFLEAGIAVAGDWSAAGQNPFEFLKRALDRWVHARCDPAIREQFSLHLSLSDSLSPYGRSDGSPNGVSRMFLTLEPDAAGYVILGPSLRLLEGFHPRLPATFLSLFLGALHRWMRVYDHRDALDHVERLREWYADDPAAEEMELPDIGLCLPPSVNRRPLCRRTLAAMTPGMKPTSARRLMEAVIELDRVSRQCEPPRFGEDLQELLADWGEPAPALLAVFERGDPIEGCFDEECQTLIEQMPAPNLVLPFDGETKEGVTGAFEILETVCATLSFASRLLTIMPGNEPVN